MFRMVARASSMSDLQSLVALQLSATWQRHTQNLTCSVPCFPSVRPAAFEEYLFLCKPPFRTREMRFTVKRISRGLSFGFLVLAFGLDGVWVGAVCRADSGDPAGGIYRVIRELALPGSFKA